MFGFNLTVYDTEEKQQYFSPEEIPLQSIGNESLTAPQNTRYGATPLQFPRPSRAPTILFNENDAKKYSIFLCGEIGDICLEARQTYEDIINILITSDESTAIDIYIDSPGGDVNLATRIMTAIMRTKARVRTIAIGDVMSAATPIWACGHEKLMTEAAVFMFHLSSHGDRGTSNLIAQTAAAVEAHIATLFKFMMTKGIFTQEEYDILIKRQNVYVSSKIMMDRLATQNTQEPQNG